MSAYGPKRTSLAAPHMSAYGPKRTSRAAPHMSAFGGKADMTYCGNSLSRSLSGAKRIWPFSAHMSAYDPKRARRSALRLLPYGKFENAARIPRANGRLIRKCGRTLREEVYLGGELDGRRTCRPQCAHRASG